MADPQQKTCAPPLLAPVDVGDCPATAIHYSLAVLSAVHNYNRWIHRTFCSYLRGKILEVGAGLGSITEFLLPAEKIVCLEPYEPFRQYLTGRFSGRGNVTISPRMIEECPAEDVPAGGFDTVLCLNVLEHIADDVAALRRMKLLLAPGGHVLALAPALPGIYGEIDRTVGHLRRYTRGSLRQAFLSAGLTPVRGRYMNFLGAAGWWWHSRVRGHAKIPARAARAFDHIVPLLAAMEKAIPPPLGQSVYLVGRA